jgi:hypothetical protein
MVKKLTLFSAALLLAAGLAAAGQTGDAKSGKWSGFITDNMCGAKNAGEKGAACTKECVAKKGAKLALYDTESKTVYVLDPQEKATGHEGHDVTVRGTLDKNSKTIHVTSLTMNKKASGM